ncbi:hypothetical protein FRC12_005993 [Ceratobasidium sp. 428]|nr:hypothetical protein FRC12_005993 [Ceratobasidium sp. 428]
MPQNIYLYGGDTSPNAQAVLYDDQRRGHADLCAWIRAGFPPRDILGIWELVRIKVDSPFPKGADLGPATQLQPLETY